MRIQLLTVSIVVALAFQAQAQSQTIQNPYPIRSKPQPSLSKAGAVQSRPAVPNRTVELPPGARYSTNYYYDYLRYYTPSYSTQSQASGRGKSGIPGLEVRAGESRGNDTLRSY